MTKPPPQERRPSPDQQAVLDEASLEELTEAKRWLLDNGQGVTRGAVATAVAEARRRSNPSPARLARLARQSVNIAKFLVQTPRHDVYRIASA
jgi:hypothetical protein